MDTDMTNADGSPFDPYGPTVPSRGPSRGMSLTYQVLSSSGFKATPSTSQQGQAEPTTLEAVVPFELFQNLGEAGVEKPPTYGGQRENDAARVWLIGIERWLWAKEVLLHKSREDCPDNVLPRKGRSSLVEPNLYPRRQPNRVFDQPHTALDR
ncbi:uncharacterized protein Z518_07427 [Rhinocladiella mackenziei CBS 650.93]|uniref:Uncharacterized protein n=1 Tax=Rhinocladiella mackenziei CBS 650.93 TaxID=1442369 RepID=A0A0D2IDH2_9EURO|nr:uncharacterized protein Z518_07427 [Rhinocladiella mackenziei CBS 650.93]KIX03874.1 hypothetical protein Z518_07427 [Rhinocladiella mackenziei CBS 650.93]